MSLERFRNPVITYFTYNLNTLPGALLYFYENNSDTDKAVYQDKAGTPHEQPVEADANGTFPPIFLDGLYRAELRSAAGVVQPNWPVDNVGTDDILVAANITADNFRAVVTGTETPGVTWSDADGKIRITFSPATFRQALGVDLGDLSAIAAAVDADAAAATSAAGVATASANFMGAWADLTGPLNMPASVTHSGSVWLLLDDLADVTASTPGVSSDWFNYSGSVAGFSNPMTTIGDIITGGASGTPTRLAAPTMAGNQYIMQYDVDTTTFSYINKASLESTEKRFRLAQGAGTATYGGGSFTAATDVDSFYNMDFSTMEIGDMLEINYSGRFSASSTANEPTIGVKIGASAFAQLLMVPQGAITQSIYVKVIFKIIKTGATTVTFSVDVESDGYSLTPKYGTLNHIFPVSSTNAIWNAANNLTIRAASPTHSRSFTRGIYTVDLIKAP